MLKPAPQPPTPPWHRICAEMGDSSSGRSQAGPFKESRSSISEDSMPSQALLHTALWPHQSQEGSDPS